MGSITATKRIIKAGRCLSDIGRQPTGSMWQFIGCTQQCHYVASRLQSLYQCVEPIEAQDLFRGGMQIETACGPLGRCWPKLILPASV